MGEIKGMGRRDFLKTAALSGLALGGAAALTGLCPLDGRGKGREREGERRRRCCLG